MLISYQRKRSSDFHLCVCPFPLSIPQMLSSSSQWFKDSLFAYYFVSDINHAYFCKPIIYFGLYIVPTFSISHLRPIYWILSDFVVLVCISNVLKRLRISLCVYLLFIVEISQSCPTFCDPMDCTCQAPLSMEFSRLLCPWNFPGKNTGEGCHSLSQGIFLTQGLNLCLLHCRQILYQLSY